MQIFSFARLLVRPRRRRGDGGGGVSWWWWFCRPVLVGAGFSGLGSTSWYVQRCNVGCAVSLQVAKHSHHGVPCRYSPAGVSTVRVHARVVGPGHQGDFGADWRHQRRKTLRYLSYCAARCAYREKRRTEYPPCLVLLFIYLFLRPGCSIAKNTVPYPTSSTGNPKDKKRGSHHASLVVRGYKVSVLRRGYELRVRHYEYTGTVRVLHQPRDAKKRSSGRRLALTMRIRPHWHHWHHWLAAPADDGTKGPARGHPNVQKWTAAAEQGGCGGGDAGLCSSTL